MSTDTPRVIRSPHVKPGEALIMQDTIFDDGKTRILVNPGMTDDAITELERAIEDSERMQRAVEAINAITARLHPIPEPPHRQAMILDFADGHREYSPEVEVSGSPGNVTITPIVPFRRIPEGEKTQ